MKPTKTLIQQLAARVQTAESHYEVLGVPPKAEAVQVKEAHRELARFFHPDRCRLTNAHDIMSRVNQAYACLSDKAARRLYDMVHKTRLPNCPTCHGGGFTHKQRGFMAKMRVPCYDCGGSGTCSD